MPWVYDDGDDWETPTPQVPTEFIVTDNNVIGEILGPDGKVISRVLEREPFGFRLRGT